MTYDARPRHPVTGRQMRVHAPTRRGLAKLLEHIGQMRSELRLGMTSALEVDRRLRRLQHGPVTFGRAAVAYLERPGLAPETRRRVESFLRVVGAELAPLELEALAAPRFVKWVEKLRGQGYASSSIGTAWRTMRAIVRHAAERGWIERAPFGNWRPTIRAGVGGRRPREAARTADELARLLAAAQGISLELEAMIATAALLGMRSRELVEMQWQDIDWNRRTVAVRSKGGAVAAVAGAPLVFVLLNGQRERLWAEGMILQQLGKRGEPSAEVGPVFPCRQTSTEGHPRFAAREVLTRHMLRRAVAAAGLPNPDRWSPHSLRDTFATLEGQGADGDLAALGARTRHANVASLARYLRSRARALPPPPLAMDLTVSR